MRSIHSVLILAKFNQYDSKKYFAARLAEAFQRKGIQTRLELDMDKWQWWSEPSKDFPDFSCSFNRVLSENPERTIWKLAPSPHVSFYLDPIFYYMDDIQNPLSISTCIDHSEYRELLSQGYRNVMLMPHAIERELCAETNQERPYEVSVLGSCYDPEGIRTYWKSLNLPDNIYKVFDAAIERVFSDPKVNFVHATSDAFQNIGLRIDEKMFQKIANLVDQYTRGYDRLALIKSIKKAHVHVFGGTGWTNREVPSQGWGFYLAGLPNVTVHPQIGFAESLEVMKKSKIVLNSAPFFIEGSHERVFAALACGALPITNKNLYWSENFIEGEEIEFYQYSDRSAIEDKVNRYLEDEALRKKVAAAGREKVMKYHTWDNRVELLLQELPPMFERKLQIQK